MGKYDSLFQRVASQQTSKRLSAQGFSLTVGGIVETINFFVNGTIKLDKGIQAFHLNKVNEFYREGNRIVAEKSRGESGYRPEARFSGGQFAFGKGTIFEGGFFNFRDNTEGEAIAGLRLVDEQRADQISRSKDGAPIWRAIENGVPPGRHKLPMIFHYPKPYTRLDPVEGPAGRYGGGTRGLHAVRDAIAIVEADLGRNYERITVQSYS